MSVVNALRATGLAALVSTQVTPYPSIPRMPLIAELEKRCGGHLVVRSDWTKVKGVMWPSSSACSRIARDGEFRDRAEFERWASSPEYREISKDRVASTTGTVLLVSGLRPWTSAGK